MTDFFTYLFHNTLDRTSEFTYTSGGEATYVLSGSAVGNNGLWHTRAIEHYGSLGTWSGVPYIVETQDGRNWEFGRGSLVSGGGAGGAHIVQRDLLLQTHVEVSSDWQSTDPKRISVLPHGPRTWNGCIRNENRNRGFIKSFTLPSVSSTSTPTRDDLILIDVISFGSRDCWVLNHGFIREWAITGSCANTGNITLHMANMKYPQTFPLYGDAQGGATWRCVAGEMFTIRAMVKLEVFRREFDWQWTPQGTQPWQWGVYAGFITGGTTFYLNSSSAATWGGACKTTYSEYEWVVDDIT
jgi:hypothetical protein